MDIEQAFGQILIKYRKKAKHSQEELAFLSELDRTFISLLERGKRKPTINTIFKLSRSLNVKPYQLVKELEELIENIENID